jgi:two-component system sensor histidine kinase TorS
LEEAAMVNDESALRALAPKVQEQLRVSQQTLADLLHC